MTFTDFETSRDAFQTLYLAYFGREADEATLDVLTQFVDAGDDATFDAIADSFAASTEFEDSYAGQSDESFVRAVYFNLFDRNPSEPEVNAWLTQYDTGQIDDGDLPLAVLQSARESDVEAYEAKLFIANYFTEAKAAGEYVPDEFTFQQPRGNAELWYDLQQLDAEYDTLDLEQVGSSLDGRPLYTATVGEGDTDVVFITQQHGDEFVSTEAAMYFLDFLAGDTDGAAEIRDELTVTVLPRVNPDGYDRLEQEIGGVNGLVDPRRNDANIDLNRTYDPDEPIDPTEAPEAQVVVDLATSIQPKVLFDYHSQGNYRTDDGDLVTLSAFWPINEAVDADVVETAKKAVVALDMAADEFDYGVLTQYPGSDTPAIARNGISERGVPTVLVETRFLQETFELTQGLDLDYSALTSALALEAFITMKGVTEKLADGSFDDIDPALADAIPERPEGISFAELYSDDLFV